MKTKLAVLAATVAITLTAWTEHSVAQGPGEVPRIGVLSYISRGKPPGTLALLDELRALGYVEGETIVVDWRGAHGDATKFPELAADLVRSKVDVIVATGNAAIQAARVAGPATPIVMVTPSDPVGLGFIRSLAHPGGNITGLTWQTREAVPKRLQLLTEAVPRLSRVAVLWDATEPARRRQVEEAQAAAPRLGVALHVFEVRSAGDLDGAFAGMSREGVGAVLVEASTMLASNRARLADLALKTNLPAIGWYGAMADSGLLMSFSPNVADQYRRAGHFVAKLLTGAQPAELPVEQPIKFELVVNLKTAKALGLTIPRPLLIKADRVIE